METSPLKLTPLKPTKIGTYTKTDWTNSEVLNFLGGKY